MRDGLKLCGLINALKLKIDLPIPAPSNDEEKKENLYHILAFLASEQHMEADHEVFEYAAQDMGTVHESFLYIDFRECHIFETV